MKMKKGFRQMVDEAKSRIKTIGLDEAKKRRDDVVFRGPSRRARAGARGHDPRRLPLPARDAGVLDRSQEPHHKDTAPQLRPDPIQVTLNSS